MGMYKYVRILWKQPKDKLGEVWRDRLIKWRKEPATIRISKPTRIDKARAIGYKAKQGIIVVRQRLKRGGRMRPTIKSGRRPKHRRRLKVLHKNYQQIAEERANRLFPNCEVLNSYYVAKDGIYIWYEVILVDTSHPTVKADKNLKWICEKQHKGRAYRGLTSAGRKSRGLRKKGKGSEKTRPSRRSNKRKI
ncbi:50S ribosomal protein L15e [Candidatus Woesearchaeota archaeon]|nr:MAG: 50S ribosomal protein L15e [Candidatus Woesearchaeota archaeon]